MDSYMISYGLTIIALIIALSSQIFVDSATRRNRKFTGSKKITGGEAARRLLDKHGLHDVKINVIGGSLTDNYNPSKRVVNLSEENYSGTDITSVCVACHECGHAIQHKDNFPFMKIRAKLFPFFSWSSKIGYFAILLGCIFGLLGLIYVGVLAECVVLLFQIITLPIEFDASKRALVEIEEERILNKDEIKKGKKVLGAAAMTYVASVAATLIQIFRLLLMVRRRDD